MSFHKILVLCIKALSVYKKLLICANNTENRSSSNVDRVFVQFVLEHAHGFPGVIT